VIDQTPRAAKLNDVDPLAWLTDVQTYELHKLLPWNWKIANTVEAPSTVANPEPKSIC
jgi:hypothetical protein